jgi:hypothetical protein
VFSNIQKPYRIGIFFHFAFSKQVLDSWTLKP